MQINIAPDKSLLAIMVIFILNYLVVKRFFLRPIAEVIEQRETERKTAEKVHEEALARFNEATAQMETQLHLAKREASNVRDRYRSEAGAHRSKVLERTQGDAKKIVGEAEAKLSTDVTVAREKIARESEALARLAAERILGRAV
jgi:F-type H+-transporting ATPase subunit b